MTRRCILESWPIELTLAAGDSVLAWVVVPRLGPLLATMPRLRITLRASSAPLEDVEAGRAHFGVGSLARRPSTAYRRVFLGERRYGLFVPRRRPIRGLGLRELLLSGPLARVSSAPEPHEAACRVAKISPEVTLACETYVQGARAVATQTFAAILPMEAEVELGKALAHVVPLAASGERIHLVARRRTLTLTGVEAFFDLLRSELAPRLR